jgi:hypothetical protein
VHVVPTAEAVAGAVVGVFHEFVDAVEEVARGDAQGVVGMGYSTAQGVPGKGRLPRRVAAVIDVGRA